MKWFKHITDSGDDPDIDDAVTLFGGDGYYIFFRTLEVMAREFDETNAGINTISVQFFRKKFRVSYGKVIKVLTFYQKRERLLFTVFDDDGMKMIRLNCPKLKDLCDEYTQKLLIKNRDTAPVKVGSIEEEEEREEEKEDGEKKGTTEKLSRSKRLRFDYKKDTLIGLEKEDVEQWSRTFPSVDIEAEIKKAVEWLIDNHAKRKKNVSSFLTRWFGRVADRNLNQAARGGEIPSRPLGVWHLNQKLGILQEEKKAIERKKERVRQMQNRLKLRKDEREAIIACRPDGEEKTKALEELVPLIDGLKEAITRQIRDIKEEDKLIFTQIKEVRKQIVKADR